MLRFKKIRFLKCEKLIKLDLSQTRDLYMKTKTLHSQIKNGFHHLRSLLFGMPQSHKFSLCIIHCVSKITRMIHSARKTFLAQKRVISKLFSKRCKIKYHRRWKIASTTYKRRHLFIYLWIIWSQNSMDYLSWANSLATDDLAYINIMCIENSIIEQCTGQMSPWTHFFETKFQSFFSVLNVFVYVKQHTLQMSKTIKWKVHRTTITWNERTSACSNVNVIRYG